MRNDDLLRQIAARTLFAAGLLGPAALAFSQTIPAFPGADGAASTVTGGRGGTVYHVTKLDASYQDTAFGTLRYGLNNANFPGGPRTIVFDVGGRINLGRVTADYEPNGNGWDTQSRMDIPSNVTIAGQTAPTPVYIMGGVVKMGGTNSILRNVTIAPGFGTRGWVQPGDTAPRKLYPDSYTYDAIDISGNHLMIDHVSMVYATDETISANELAHTLTIQYSNISQGQNYPQADAEATGVTYTGHALGSLLQAGSNAKVSVHHNLYAQQKGRLPRVGSEVGTGAINDFRNNVFYNWLGTAGSGASGQPSFNNFVANFYLAGPGGDDAVGGTSTAITTRSGGTSIFSGASSSATRIYHSGNLKDTNKDGDALDGVALSNSDFGSATFVSQLNAGYSGVTDSAVVAYDRVLNYMGARWWERDSVIDTVDERLIHEVRTGTGKIKAWADDPYDNDPSEGVEWRSMVNAAAAARATTWDQENDIGFGRGDGMPTWWEVAHGLNPFGRDDAGDFDADGYTNLEEYLNEIAAWPAPAPIVFNGATNGRYEQITNWDIAWQPSKFDEARIHNGAVTINSVGQHAGVLKIAPDAGNSATLTLTAGWIDVAQQLQIANNGQLIMAAGQLLVPAVQLSHNALLKLNPGGNKVLALSQLSISGAAKLDLTDNRLVMKSGNVAAVEGAIRVARNGGSWNGAGITTSMPDAAAGLTTLATAIAGGPGGVLNIGAAETAMWGGQMVRGDDVLVRYTYAGDADLDGFVSADDYTAIDFAIAIPGASGYANGDFNYDGMISADDYTIIDFNIIAQGSPFPSFASRSAVVTVPEPGMAAVLVLAGGAVAFRRRRAQRMQPIRVC